MYIYIYICYDAAFLDSLDDIRGVLQSFKTMLIINRDDTVLHILPSFIFWRGEEFTYSQDLTAYFMVFFYLLCGF